VLDMDNNSKKSCIITGDIYTAQTRIKKDYNESTIVYNDKLYVELSHTQIDEIKQIKDVNVLINKRIPK
jgi:hypothetical protein